MKPDVLLANTTSAPAAASSWANSSRFTSSRSGPVSTTRSASAAAVAGSAWNTSRVRSVSASKSASLIRTASRSAGSAPGAGSLATTSSPAAISRAAQLEPIAPVPMTATRRTSAPAITTPAAGRPPSVTKTSQADASARASRLATSSGRAPCRIFDRDLELLAGSVARDRRHRDDLVGYVSGRQGLPQLGGDGAAECVVARDAWCGTTNSSSSPFPPRVRQVDDEGVGDLRQLLDDPVELRRTEPHTAAVQRRVGAAGDLAGCRVDDDPVAVPPTPGYTSK